MAIDAVTGNLLARCNGFRVTALGEVVGSVATPVFSGISLVPEYLLVRVVDGIAGTYRAVPPRLIAGADADSKTVSLRIEPRQFEALAECAEVAARILPNADPATAKALRPL